MNHVSYFKLCDSTFMTEMTSDSAEFDQRLFESSMTQHM